MARSSIVGAVCLLLVGCGGGSSSGTGGHGGGSAGATGTGGATGRGGGGGLGTGAGGSSAAGGTGGSGGTSGALPACAITTRPTDPTDPNADGGYRDPHITHACNAVDPSGPWVTPEVLTWGDAGAPIDGGVPVAPTGGVVLDGDYDLVRILFPNPTTNPTRRTFRVFDSGTYIERAVLTQDPTVDGGMSGFWYDTNEAPAGTDFGSSAACGAVGSSDRYTAEGDMLTLFVYGHGVDDPSPIGIDVYRRTCTRP